MVREKIFCEICGNKDVNILNRHHIVPQCDNNCTNKDYNIAILCPNCHTKVHDGDYIIIGLYPSTSQWKLLWFKKGEEPPIKEEFWLIKPNPLILRRGRHGKQ